MNPYELLLDLKNNRILFSYMETSAIYLEGTDWVIIGDSGVGELRISVTASNTLRVAIPIMFPKNIPLAVLESILTKIEPELDGLLKGEEDTTFGGVSLFYYIHVGFSNYDKDLDTALIRFLQDKRTLETSLRDISKTINKLAMPVKNNSNSAKSLNNIWDDINNIDKKGTGPLTPESPEDPNEDDDVDTDPPKPF